MADEDEAESVATPNEVDSIVEMPKPTLSELLLTPEERRARQEYRLTVSQCCVREAWKRYRQVTNTDTAIEPMNLSLEEPRSQMITRMGVLYDPTAGLRMRFLKKKFSHLLDGCAALKQAAYKPYIRCQRPKQVDTKDQRLSMPAVAKTFLREVCLSYVHPSTFAYKEKWSKTFNRNFVTKEDMLRDQEDQETQTMQADVYATKKIRRKEKIRDTTVERFDLEDIPLDNEGNPIGKSVGICEWCGRSILPIPSEYTLTVEWNIDALYCCNKYRLFIEDVKKTTHALEAEAAKKRFLIEIGSKGRKKGKKYEPGAKDDRPDSKQRKTMVGKMYKILQEKFIEEAEERIKHMAIDTSDLPWDPVETRYYQQQRANESRRSAAPDIDIVVGLEEVYT